MLPSSMWESHAAKARRHGVSGKTLDRWAASGTIDKPIYVNGRKYHRVDSQPRRDSHPRKPQAAAEA